MPEILHLDEPLYHALRRSNRTDKPDGFCLPSKKERNDAELQLVARGELEPPSAKDAKRLASAAGRRWVELQGVSVPMKSKSRY
jgi:hypothetical protein